MKKLLILTQAVDLDDPYVGFFHHWIEALAARFASVEAICLKEGRHALPANVHVHSLGKERGPSRIKYVMRFFRYAWSLRNGYDTVFVHMNQEYVILGGWLWRLMGKRIALWRNFPTGNRGTDIAVFFAHRVFCTAPQSYTARFAKTSLMPVGIDTDFFAPRSVARVRTACYIQGRVTPSKRVHLLLEAVALLSARGVDVRATVVGPEDPEYARMLRERFAGLISAGRVSLLGPKPLDETPIRYASHGIMINLALPGHFDKTAFEGMACETPLIAVSGDFAGIIPPEWIVPDEDAAALASAIGRMIALPEAAYRALGARERAAVATDHSLLRLVDLLAAAL